MSRMRSTFKTMSSQRRQHYRLKCKQCGAIEDVSHPEDGNLQHIRDLAAREMPCGHSTMNDSIIIRARVERGHG